MSGFGDYFFCGVGGSGMASLALIIQAMGGRVEGSDRALDQGRTGDKFAFLRERGVVLHPQDGSGVQRSDQIVVTSAAVEETVPDVQAARRVGATIVTRARLLADLFNRAPLSIGVAGTSGKSTTVGMISWILDRAGRNPTVMNGAVMTNFVTPELPFASARIGDGQLFVSEIDESDGSIALFAPTIALVNNISLDHKSLDELRSLFHGFVAKAQSVVLNLDNEETATLASELKPEQVTTYSLTDKAADLVATSAELSPAGVTFRVTSRASGESVAVVLGVPGLHNIANALAALGAAIACGVSLADAAAHLGTFTGMRRRLEMVGTAQGVTVIDDFAHNPDKIAATLKTLRAFPGRLLVMFQPHGFGPLRLMRRELVDSFVGELEDDDLLVMPEPLYFGGTVERSVTSGDIAADIAQRGRQASALADRTACGEELLKAARSGDRIVVMGARDDTLSEFARDLVQQLARRDRDGSVGDR